MSEPISTVADPEPATLPGENVLLELAGLAFQHLEPRLHRVADADDAGQMAFLDHGHMPEPSLGHDLQHLVDMHVDLGRGHGFGHQIADLEVEQSGAVLIERMNDVAL